MKNMVSLSKLFKDSIFRIPDYQRGYAWDNDQLNDFWDDLYNLTENRYHYTGMLSLKELTEKEYSKWDEGEKWLIGSGFTPYHIVDGQQRLTTFIILLNSIIELAYKENIEYFDGISISDIKEHYIVKTKKPTEIIKAYKFGYEIDNPSFKYLRYKILKEKYSGSIDESFYTLKLQNAKDFFDKKIAEVYKEKGLPMLETLYKKLVNKLQFNIHDIDDDFDVFIAFETMNNRGKKLSNLEILKNRLIYLTTIFPDNILSFEEKATLRKNINETWREVYHQLGRNKDKPLDDDEYLRAHWTMFYKYTRNKGDDYIQFLLNKQFTPKAVYGENVELIYKAFDGEEYEVMEELYDNEEILVPKEISDYVNSLKELAKYWYSSNNPDDAIEFTTEERKWLNKLNHIGINYFRTLVVSAMINKNVTSDQRIRLYKSIEKFIFLCFRLAKYNANYDSVPTYKYARLLYLNEINIEEIISFYNNEFEKNVTDALNAFKADMARLFANNEGFYSWYPRWYFLFEYEASLSEGRNIVKLNDWNAFTKSDQDKISIEHIFPQKPTAYYWRNNFRKYQNENEQHILTNSLGNLLALSQSINSSLQNDEFDLKKKPRKGNVGYANGSYSEMEVAAYQTWTPQTILERGLHLLSFMEKRWEFKFPNEDFKIAILGLDFLNNGRQEVDEIVDADYKVKDKFFTGDKGEIKVSEYLGGKDIYLIAFYEKIFNEIKNRIPSLFEVATKNYIALKCDEFSRNIAEVHIQNSKKKICFITKAPTTPEFIKGEILPDSYLWSLNYREYVDEDGDYSNIANIIAEAYKNMQIIKQSDEEETLNELQLKRSNKLYAVLHRYEEVGKIYILTHAKRYTRFATKVIRDKVGLLGDGSWSGISDLIVWEIDNRWAKCSLSLYIGPSAEEDRNKWYEIVKNNKNFIVGRKTSNWTSIYRIQIIQEDDDKTVEHFRNVMETIVKQIDNEFSNM